MDEKALQNEMALLKMLYERDGALLQLIKAAQELSTKVELLEKEKKRK